MLVEALNQKNLFGSGVSRDLKPFGVMPHFGKAPHYRSDKSRWIDKDVYNILFRLPKAELHVHQGGSSDVSYLKYRLFKEIKEGQRKQLAYLSPKNSKHNNMEYVVVKKLDELSDEKILEILNLLTVRRLLRFDAAAQYKLMYLDEPTINKLSDTGGRLVLDGMNKLIEKNKNLLNEYRGISKIINPITKNTPSAYFLASLFAREAMLEHARYAEYRVSPFGRTDIKPAAYDGSGPQDVVHAVQAGFEDANLRVEKSGRRLEYGIILLMERNPRSVPKDTPPEKIAEVKQQLLQDAVNKAIATAKEAVKLKKKGYKIVGIDLAGGEATAPVTDFKPAFDVIHAYNETAPKKERLGITIHSGETPVSGNLKGYESIEKSIELGYTNGNGKTPFRIGHGIQIINSSPLLRQAYEAYCNGDTQWQTKYPIDALKASSPLLNKVLKKSSYIHFEMCPKSNVQTQGIGKHELHPAMFLLRLGVNVGLSTDNRTISNTDITNELVKQYKHHALTYDEAKTLVRNSFNAAFIFDNQVRRKLLTKVEDELWDIEHSPKYYKGVYKLQYGPDETPTDEQKMEWLARSTAEVLAHESQKIGYDFTELTKKFNAFADAKIKLKSTGI